MSNIEKIRNELSAPIKSIRVFAIESALSSVPSRELLDCLTEFHALETDAECKILFEHVISQVSEKFENRRIEATSVDNILSQFPNQNPAEQLKSISQLRVAQLRKLDHAKVIADLLKTSKDNLVAAGIVKKFRKYWPEKFVPFLEKHVFSNSKALQIACIETLVLHFPDSLKDKLVKLVFINDPVIRSLSIRGMAKQFPALAAAFINECFTKGDLYNKATAIKICSTFRFDLIKDSLLTLIEIETELKLVEGALTVILGNPDREIPFRLIEMMFRIDKQKAQLIKAFFPEYCKVLEASEICENFQAYMTYLNQYPEIIQSRLIIAKVFAGYQQADEITKQANLEYLASRINEPIFKKELEKYSSQIRNPEIESQISALLGHKEVPKPEFSPEIEHTAKPEENGEVKDNDLLKKFSRNRFKNQPEVIEQIKPILQDDSRTDTLRAAALKAAGNLEIVDYVPLAKSWLKIDNEKLTAASLEYLSNFDPDDFQRIIQKFINTNSQLVRITLIRITALKYPDYAKFLLKHMLCNKNPDIRKYGLEASIHFDFFYLLPDLIEFLQAEREIERIKDGISLLLSNPSLETIYHLQNLEKSNYVFRDQFSKASREIKAFLKESGLASNKEIAQFLEQKASETQKKTEQKKESQELEKELEKAKEKVSWNSVSASVKELDINWKKMLFLFFGSFAFLTLLNYLIFGGGTASDPTEEKKLQPVLSELSDYEAIVEKTYPPKGKVIVKNAKDEKETFILNFPNKAYTRIKFMKKGDRLTISGKPYKRNIDGVLFIRVNELKGNTNSSANE